MTAVTASPSKPTAIAPAEGAWRHFLRRNAWGLGLLGVLIVLLVVTKLIHPTFGAFDLETLARASLPIGLAAVAQAIVVIAGGIDLSVGAVMAFASITAAVLMERLGDPASFGVVVFILLLGLGVGFVNGGLVVITRVPDIIVTLATSFVWAGAALLVLSKPGGKGASWFTSLASGGVLIDLLPKVARRPHRRRRRWSGCRSAARASGLSLYSVGSDRLAAFRSGVPGRADEGRGVRAGRAVRGGWRPGADDDDRHRLAGPRGLHARRRRRHRARRRQPRGRPGRAARPDHRRVHPRAHAHRT